MEATVSKIVEETSEIKTLRLEFSEGGRLDFRPGQFASLCFPDDRGLVGSYPICSSPLETGFAEIAILDSAPLTRRLRALSGGETVLLKGAEGDWSYRDEDRSAALACSGAGIAAARSMIRYALDKGLPNKLALFYAVPVPSRIAFRVELEDFARRGVTLHLSVTEPKSMAEGESWDGPSGRLSAPKMRRALPWFREASFYLCGEERFIGGLRPALIEAGIARARIHCART